MDHKTRRYRIKLVLEGGTEQDIVMNVPREHAAFESTAEAWLGHIMETCGVAKEIWLDEIIFSAYHPITTITADGTDDATPKRKKFVKELGFRPAKDNNEFKDQRGWESEE